MKRPLSWLYWTLLIVFLLIAGEYAAMTWIAPRHLIRVAERFAGSSLSVGSAHLSFPLTTTLTSLQLLHNTPEAAFTVQRVRVEPRWYSAPRRMLWVRTVHIERPLLRLTRTEAGTTVWPSLPPPRTTLAATKLLERVQIETLQVEDATIEFVDYRALAPFHAVLQHVSFVVGPVTVPLGGPHMSFALRGEFVGHGGDAAPFYCSGWAGLDTHDLQASCHLEPMMLSAFEPYYRQKKVKVRVYQATAKSTSQWAARGNVLEARIQIGLGSLEQADVSVHGRTVVDAKELTEGAGPALNAEFKITGPLDRPAAWRWEFVPGDVAAQRLIKPLLDQGIEMLKIPFGGQKIGVSLTTASVDTMHEIEDAGREIEEALELLAAPEEALPVIEPSPAAPALAEPESPTPPAAEPPSEVTPPAPPAPPAPQP